MTTWILTIILTTGQAEVYSVYATEQGCGLQQQHIEQLRSRDSTIRSVECIRVDLQ